MQRQLMVWATALVVAFGSLAGLAVKTAVAQTSPASLVISAIQITGGVGKTAEDFIELYNPNPFPVDLNGYRLVKRTATVSADSSIKVFNTETLIPSYSFYLWANSGFTEISANPDTTTSSTLADNNGVGLRFGALDSGQLIDSVSWGTSNNGFTSISLENPQAGESLVRVNLFEQSEFEIRQSNPRNTSVQLLPEGVEESVNDASCSVLLKSESGAQSMSGIRFLNTGNSAWFASGFSVSQQSPEGFSEISLPEPIIYPGSQFDLEIEITAPATAGEYSYSWQMEFLGEGFGSSCSTILNVEEVVTPDPEPEPEPEPEPNPTTVKITELLPNPVGDDSGKEVVELYNYGSQTVNLKDWVLDDIESWPVSSNAYKLGEISIEAGKYLAITIPAGKFAMNNTGGDVVTLFNPSGSIISTVTYTGTTPEGKTYSLVGSEWGWFESSLGIANPPLPESEPETPEDPDPEPENPEVPEQPEAPNLTGLIISEIYPAPSAGQREFVELYNGSNSSLNLKFAKLAIGNRVASLPDFLLPSGGYYSVADAELKLPLADSGKTIQLLSENGAVLSEVTYPKAKKGESYALFGDSFMWTKTVTPGQANELNTVVPNPEPGNNSPKASVKAAATNLLQHAINSLNSETQQPIQPDPETGEPGKKTNPINAIIVALASLFASAFAVYKFGV